MDSKENFTEQIERLGKIRKEAAEQECIVDELDISHDVAVELWLISGGDVDAVIEESLRSDRLSECKARLINRRFKKLEERINSLT